MYLRAYWYLNIFFRLVALIITWLLVSTGLAKELNPIISYFFNLIGIVPTIILVFLLSLKILWVCQRSQFLMIVATTLFGLDALNDYLVMRYINVF